MQDTLGVTAPVGRRSALRALGAASLGRSRVRIRKLLIAALLACPLTSLSGCGQSDAQSSEPISAGSAGRATAAGGQAGTFVSGAGAGGSHLDSAGAPNAIAGMAGASATAAGQSAGGAANQAGAGAGGTSAIAGAGGVAESGGSAGAAAAGASGNPANGTDKITVWLAGDSTMADGSSTCPVGWGKQFQAHFNANAKVVNSAVGGTTVRSWLYDVTSTLGSDGECTLGSQAPQARWTTIQNGMKKGDYLFVQFGINDTTSNSCPKHVSVDTFKKLFGMMAQAAKDKGAQPVFLTAVSSISCQGSVAQGTRGGFAAATKDAGAQYGVPVIDLEQASVALYTSLGFCPSTDSSATFSANTPIGNFFCNDHTHFEAAGAKQIGNLVAKGISDQHLGLASYLVAAGN